MGPAQARQNRRRRFPRARWWVPATVLVLVVAAGITRVEVAWGIRAPKTSAALPATLRRVPDPAGGAIPWPGTGEAAMTVPGVLSFAPTGTTAAVPIASITKVMTVLVLLADKPLAVGEQGPSMTITAADVAETAADQAANESFVPVILGEQLSELQMIEAMLVPSADNIAQMAAVWDAGSEQAFVSEMNGLAAQWGLRHTTFADPAGLSPDSVSTATDLLTLGERAMANPVVASVVALSKVTLPGATSPFSTYDFDLGEDGIVGIKTGSDAAAGGCFLFAATVEVDGRSQLAYGDVLGQQSHTSVLDQAMSAALGLVKGLHRVLSGITLLRAGEEVGSISVPWAPTGPLEAAKGVSVVAPPGTPVVTAVHLEHLRSGRPVAAGTTVGELEVRVGTASWRVPIVTKRAVGTPTAGWLLVHW